MGPLAMHCYTSIKPASFKAQDVGRNNARPLLSNYQNRIQWRRTASVLQAAAGNGETHADDQEQLRVEPAAEPTSSESPETSSTSTNVQEPQQLNWRTMFQRSLDLLKINLWPLILVHFLCDALVFLLHRLSHRLTNEAAVALLSSTGITPQVIGNMWWLSADPAIANFQTGYQALTLVVFVLAFPLNILLKTGASIATLLICKDTLGADTKSIPWWKPLTGLRSSLPLLSTLKPSLLSLWRPIFLVELAVAAVVVPLQFASLAVVTLPLTLPIILGLQAAAPAAILEGQRGVGAMKRSWKLLKPLRWQLAVPFVSLVVASRLAEAVKGYVLTAMPARYYRELVEIPVVVVAAGAVLSLVLARLQDVLPYAAYEHAVEYRRRKKDGNNDTQNGSDVTSTTPTST